MTTMRNKKVSYEAKDIASYFVYLASQEIIDEIDGEKVREGITHLKLQKILYFAQAYFLAKTGRSLFNDTIEAWKYGPVVKSVYRKYKKHGNKPITEEKNRSVISNEDREMMKSVWRIFGKYSASQLVSITHSQGPWKDAIEKDNKTISPGALREYYKDLFVAR